MIVMVGSEAYADLRPEGILPLLTMKYITKSDRWFDVGTEAFPVTEFWEEFKDKEMTQPVMAAIFSGIRNGKPDEESCPVDEFEVIDEPA